MATGRLSVAPGQTIASSWGNTTFDQSVMCFASAADRDNQIPAGARHLGMVAWLDDLKQITVWDGTVWARLAGPTRRFNLWRTSVQAIAADGWTSVTFDGKDDPNGMAPAGAFVAPFAGLVAISATVSVTFSGTPPTSLNVMASLWASGAELRRGSQWATASPGSAQGFASHVSGIFAVTAGLSVTCQVNISAPSATKQIAGGAAVTYMEGAYIG